MYSEEWDYWGTVMCLGLVIWPVFAIIYMIMEHFSISGVLITVVGGLGWIGMIMTVLGHFLHK